MSEGKHSCPLSSLKRSRSAHNRSTSMSRSLRHCLTRVRKSSYLQNTLDCLHQAAAVEEQEKQLKEIHKSHSTDHSRLSEWAAQDKQELFRQKPAKYSSTSRRPQQYGKCGTKCHKLQDCLQGSTCQEGTQPGQLQV